jgi:hypothetical protein
MAEGCWSELLYWREFMKDDFIERRIITGLIVSTEYIQAIRPQWDLSLLEAAPAKLIASWCLEYFEKYNQAPKKDIEGIFAEKLLKDGVPKQRQEDIEEILSGLSAEYEHVQFNHTYLLDQTRNYFREQRLRKLVDGINAKVSSGALVEAEQLATTYAPASQEGQYNAINPFASAVKFRQAFEERHTPLIQFPINRKDMKALGDFWNDQLARDNLVALMGSEKRGKTFMLMELSMRAMMSGCNVVFFQAGDMTENQQLVRLGIYLARKSDMKKYCGELWLPEMDCFHNQTDTCPNPTARRKEYDALFTQNELKKELTRDHLIKLFNENPTYEPCRDCPMFTGAIWVTRRASVQPLTWKEAYKKAQQWQKKHTKHYKLCTYDNETLTVSEIKSLLTIWERQEGFVPDVIVIDYADILAPDSDCSRLDYRHQQNKLWQRLRRLSQERHCLVVTATQAAASSYEKDSLTLSDFSEDKRKYAHVTAMYGLNQKPEEKRIGLMRINSLVIREDDFIPSDQVKILQRLQIGRPFLGSFR